MTFYCIQPLGERWTRRFFSLSSLNAKQWNETEILKLHRQGEKL